MLQQVTRLIRCSDTVLCLKALCLCCPLHCTFLSYLTLTPRGSWEGMCAPWLILAFISSRPARQNAERPPRPMCWTVDVPHLPSNLQTPCIVYQPTCAHARLCGQSGAMTPHIRPRRPSLQVSWQNVYHLPVPLWFRCCLASQVRKILCGSLF